MAISGGGGPPWGVEYHADTRLSHVRRDDSLFALFQRERFALVRRRHGCGGRKGWCARFVTSNPKALHTGGGGIRVIMFESPSLREDLRDALKILATRLLRVGQGSRSLAGNESQKWIEERSTRRILARVGSGVMTAHNHGLLVAGPMRRGPSFALSGWGFGDVSHIRLPHVSHRRHSAPEPETETE